MRMHTSTGMHVINKFPSNCMDSTATYMYMCMMYYVHVHVNVNKMMIQLEHGNNTPYKLKYTY